MTLQTMAERKEKKILVVDLGDVMGGVEYYIETLADILKERADILSLCVPPELTRRLRSKGLKVFSLPAVRWLKPVRFLLAFCVLPMIILRERVQIVVVNGLLEAVLLIPARVLGCDAVYARHGPFEDDLYKWYANPARYFPRLIARLCAGFASHVICVSEDVGKCVRKSSSRGTRISVIPLWVPNMPPYDGQKRDPGKLLRLPAFYVGRLERYKGLYLLLEALRGIPNVTLTVVGDGSYRKELERLAEGINVRFEGFQSDTGKYYRETDIFCDAFLGARGIRDSYDRSHGAQSAMPCE